jgi:hypothetical protein
MTKADHALTPTNGQQQGFGAEQEKETALINKGQFIQAQQLGINFLRTPQFKGKYEYGIKQMQSYTNTLINLYPTLFR